MTLDHPMPDLDRPNSARMYDYLLGGSYNFAVDRAAADAAIARCPDAGRIAVANRRFLGRVVRWCLDQGITQFLDLGCGIPSVGSTHEVAHGVDPRVRIAYVDCEPVALAVGRRLSDGSDTVTVTPADVRHPDQVLRAGTVTGLLDFDRPVAVLAVAVLHFLPEGPAEVLAPYRAALAPGSAVALSHGGDDIDDPELDARLRAGIEVYRNSANPVYLRSRAELADALGGQDALVAPGMVDIGDWPTPGPAADATGNYGAVARIR